MLRPHLWTLVPLLAVVAVGCGTSHPNEEGDGGVPDGRAADASSMDAACDSVPTELRCASEGQECFGSSLVVCAPNAAGCLVRSATECEDGCTGTGEAARCEGCRDSCTLEEAMCRTAEDGRSELVSCERGPDGCLTEKVTLCESGCDELGTPEECHPVLCPYIASVAEPIGCGETVTATVSERVFQDFCRVDGAGPEKFFIIDPPTNAQVTVRAQPISAGSGVDGNLALFASTTPDARSRNTECVPVSCTLPVGETTGPEEATASAIGRPLYVVYESEGAAEMMVRLSVECEFATCGDGAVEAYEECEDGNTADGDGCSSACRVEHGYSCEGSTGVSVCERQCGDGVAEPGAAVREECDDGNTVDFDGCSRDCKVEPGYTCTVNALGGTDCALRCGDGRRDVSLVTLEECDDGNTVDGDGCSAVCTVEPGYSCDFGAEPTTCEFTCGDGVSAGIRSCDDGNTDAGDGCSPVCEVEAGAVCYGRNPSACTHVLGYQRGVIDHRDPVAVLPSAYSCEPRPGNPESFWETFTFENTTDEPMVLHGTLTAYGTASSHVNVNLYPAGFDPDRPEEGCVPTELGRIIVEPGETTFVVTGRVRPAAAYAYELTFVDAGFACGNFRVDDETGETCDDGNRVGGDGCDEYCSAE